MDLIKNISIPPVIVSNIQILKKSGFEGYLVGGCVRDLLLGRKPKDWDFTTNATPEEIIALYPKTFYENCYGTVGIVTYETLEDGSKHALSHLADVSDETLRIIEVTPYRQESGYSDRRRPDTVAWSKSLSDDLKRRDFTINALALDISEEGRVITIVDLYEGQKDLANGLIRAVGDANERFAEDALRIMRAVRLGAELGFTLEGETLAAMAKNAPLLREIAMERIRDEFSRTLLSKEPMIAIGVMQRLAILKHVMPELEEGIGCEQNQAHSFDVWTHLLKSLQCAADKNWSLEIRLAALLHDIGKPASRRRDSLKSDWTFYGHEVIGARMAKKILERLRYPAKTIQKVVTLVRWHMFFSDTEQITLSAVRRMIVNVGKENIWDLMDVRICDRIGTGRPKEDPYRLRKYHAMIEEAMRDPVSVGMLKIDGKGIMEVTRETPGPKIGFILHALLEEVLEDPKKNTAEYLQNKALELNRMAIEELKKLGEAGKEKKVEEEERELAEIRRSHGVK